MSNQSFIDCCIFKSYDQRQWQRFKKEGKQIWRYRQKGTHYVPHQIPNNLSFADLQTYQFRYLHDYNLVKVQNIVRLKQEYFFQNNCQNVVLIQYIIAKLSDIQALNFEQALTVLRTAFKGFSLLYTFYQHFPIQIDMISVNQFGKVKVWLNKDVMSNQPIIIKQTNCNLRKLSVQNIRNIFRWVQNKIKNGFPSTFRLKIKLIETFTDASEYIQSYIAENKLIISNCLSLKQLKIQKSNIQLNKDIILPEQLKQRESEKHSLNKQRYIDGNKKYKTVKSNRNMIQVCQKIKYQKDIIDQLKIKCRQQIQKKTKCNQQYHRKNNSLIQSPDLKKTIHINISKNQNYNINKNNIITNNQINHIKRNIKPQLQDKKQTKIVNQENKCIQSLKVFKNEQIFLKTQIKTQEKSDSKASKDQIMNNKKIKKMDNCKECPQEQDKVYQRNFILQQDRKSFYPLKRKQTLMQDLITEEINECINEPQQLPTENDFSVVINKLSGQILHNGTVESEVDEMEDSLGLMKKLNIIKIDGLMEERKRRQTLQSPAQIENILRKQNSTKNQLTTTKIQQQQKSQLKCNSFQLKPKSQFNINKIEQSNNQKIVKQSYDTFYTTHDPYGINSKYEKYVVKNREKNYQTTNLKHLIRKTTNCQKKQYDDQSNRFFFY